MVLYADHFCERFNELVYRFIVTYYLNVAYTIAARKIKRHRHLALSRGLTRAPVYIRNSLIREILSVEIPSFPFLRLLANGRDGISVLEFARVSNRASFRSWRAHAAHVVETADAV